MKEVIIMRHAKSSWDHQGLSDHQRPLNDRGKNDAPRMDQLLKKKGIKPDLILSSDSARTRETLSLMTNLKNVKTLYTRDLYLADENELLQHITDTEDNVSTLMILAHNPGVTYLIFKLCRERIDNMPTAGIAVIDLKVNSFKDFEAGNAELLEFLYPKML